MVLLRHYGLAALVGLQRCGQAIAQGTEEPQPFSPTLVPIEPTTQSEAAPIPTWTEESSASEEPVISTVDSSSSEPTASPSGIPSVDVGEISELGFYGQSPPVYPSRMTPQPSTLCLDPVGLTTKSQWNGLGKLE